MLQNLSDPKPPLSPDVEAYMQMVARTILDLVRDYRDGKLNSGIPDFSRTDLSAKAPVPKTQPLQEGRSPVPSKSLEQPNYSASVLNCQRWSKVSNMSNTPDAPVWIGMKDALAILGISRNTLKSLIQTGKLPAYTVEGVVGYRFKRHEVEALIKPVVPKGAKEKKAKPQKPSVRSTR